MIADVLDPRMNGVDPAELLDVSAWSNDQREGDEDVAGVVTDVRRVLEAWQETIETTVERDEAIPADTKERIVAAVVAIQEGLGKGREYRVGFVKWALKEREWVKEQEQDGLEEYVRLLDVVLKN